MAASWRINMSFLYGKTTFLCREKDRTLTYQRLISFVASFIYLRFLDTRLSLGPSLFPIPLILRYMVTSRLGFYQTWFLIFWVVIYFVGGLLDHDYMNQDMSEFPLKISANQFCEINHISQTVHQIELTFYREILNI